MYSIICRSLTIQTMDKELTLKQQAVEMHKSKALESVQGIQEWQLNLRSTTSRAGWRMLSQHRRGGV